MKSLKILNTSEMNKIIQKLEKQFGIKKIPGILIMKGKERIFLFNGDVAEKELEKLDSIAEIERAGIYIGKIFQPTNEIRLSIEGTQIFKNQISKNIFILDSQSDYEKWMNGQELNIKTNLRGMIVITYQDEFLGCGKASENKIGNFIPKNRRLKIK